MQYGTATRKRQRLLTLTRSALPICGTRRVVLDLGASLADADSKALRLARERLEVHTRGTLRARLHVATGERVTAYISASMQGRI